MIKVKTCEVMQYLDFYDTTDLKVIESRVKTLTNLRKYALIIHDKDLLDSGEPKRPHFHLVLTFSNATTSQVIANVLKVEEQYINKIKTTTKSALLYLVHRNDLKKYQYSADEVLANFDYVDYVDGVLPKVDLKDIANKIDNGTIKAYNLFDYVSINDYALHKTYFDRCFEYRQNKLRSIDRNMECLFITGASGTGKTSIAKDFALKRDYSVYISSGGKNPLDNYKGEDCIILDDLRDTTYSLSDFLKLTDNNTNSLVGCRFYNKSISECKMLIVTSVKPIEEFYKVVAEKEREPQQQLFRRFQCLIKVDFKFLYFYAYIDSAKDYVFQAKMINPISLKYNTSVAKNFAENFAKALGLELVGDELKEELSKDDTNYESLQNLFFDKK